MWVQPGLLDDLICSSHLQVTCVTQREAMGREGPEWENKANLKYGPKGDSQHAKICY
jgi:hypothetical protein